MDKARAFQTTNFNNSYYKKTCYNGYKAVSVQVYFTLNTTLTP